MLKSATVAVCCSVLQCVAECCSVLQRIPSGPAMLVGQCCSVMQCIAAYGSVLQCVVVCCSVAQCGAVFSIRFRIFDLRIGSIVYLCVCVSFCV